MTTRGRNIFTSQDGQRGEVELNEVAQGDRARLHLENGQVIEVPAGLLKKLPNGEYFLPVDLHASAEERQDGFQTDSSGMVFPVIEEELVVGKRTVETGRVKVTKRIHTEEQVVDEPEYAERLDVERVPKDEWLERPANPYYDGDTLVIPVMEEVLVVEKRLRLREEVRLTKRRVEEHHPQSVTLRKEEVYVDHEGDGEEQAHL